jgi:poly(ADP-ribose) glycohydrolase
MDTRVVQLPCSRLSLCEDRFSLTDSQDLLVPSWSILLAVLASLPTSVESFIELLDTITATLHTSRRTDFGFLRRFIENVWDHVRFLSQVWPKLVELALDMPSLFPGGYISPLTPDHQQVRLSRRQVACLVVHQFLCTFSVPEWISSDGSPDFQIWYGSEPLHPDAIHAYLYSLFTYFDRITTRPSDILDVSTEDWPITFTLRLSGPLSTPPSCRFTSFTIHEVRGASTDPHYLGLPNGASVISANKRVGFGRTGTQEETHVGCSPEACPAVLITPPLSDNEVLVVEGAEAMIVMEGHGRKARLSSVLFPDYTLLAPQMSCWRKRTMLFMDALELDHYDTSTTHFVPDLIPGHLDRELVKALTAFKSRKSPPYEEVVTGLWGCGAFGGNKQIKTVLQWCVASLASVPACVFVCDAEERHFLLELREFVKLVVSGQWDVIRVLEILQRLGPTDEGGKMPFRYLAERLALPHANR